MEITGSALTALFVGLVWTLIKVVEFFISKKNKKSITKSDQLDNISKKLELIEERMVSLEEVRTDQKMISMLSEINSFLKIINKDIEKYTISIEDGQNTISERFVDLLSSQKLIIERVGDIISKLK